jgi:K+-sensing histidine kinase KdpD
MKNKNFHQYIENMNKTVLILINIVSTLSLGAVDYATGMEYSFSIIYLIPISFSSWFIGKKFAVIMAILSGLSWFFTDLISGHYFSSTIILAWNSLIRLFLFIIIANLIYYFKDQIIKNHHKELILEKEKVVIDTLQKLTRMIVNNITLQNAEIIKWVNNKKKKNGSVPDVLVSSSRVIGESLQILSEVSFVSPYITSEEWNVDMYLKLLEKKLSKVHTDLLPPEQ